MPQSKPGSMRKKGAINPSESQRSKSLIAAHQLKRVAQSDLLVTAVKVLKDAANAPNPDPPARKDDELPVVPVRTTYVRTESWEIKCIAQRYRLPNHNAPNIDDTVIM